MVKETRKKTKSQTGNFMDKKNLVNTKNIQFIDNIIAVILLIAVGVLPLLVRVKLIQFASPTIAHDLINSGIKGDIFTYYKWGFLVFLTVMALIFLVWKIAGYRYELRDSYINLPVLALVVLTVLSGVLSEFPSISLFGMYNRHEGSLTYLCYFSLFFVAANTNFKEWFRKYIFIALYVLVSINLLIILFDFYGKDLLNNQLVRLLIVPSYLPETGLQGHLNSTLSNPNYVSGFSAALMLFFLTASLLEDNFRRRLIHGIFAVFSFVMILASLSTSGFITAVILLPVIVGIALLSKRYLQVLITTGAVMAACAILLFVLNWHNPVVWDESVGSFKILLKTSTKISYSFPELKYILLPKVSEAATTSGEEKKPKNEGNGVLEKDVTDDFNLPGISQSAGTGRLYLWQKTIDLIGQRPILGYGHDTLAYYFPQDDYYKVSNLGDYDEIVTKPHNFYLDLAYSSGVLSLLSLGMLLIIYFYFALRNLANDIKSGKLKVFQTALLAFVCAFLLQWMFNDSIIATSVILWVLLGVSVSLNSDTKKMRLAVPGT